MLSVFESNLANPTHEIDLCCQTPVSLTVLCEQFYSTAHSLIQGKISKKNIKISVKLSDERWLMAKRKSIRKKDFKAEKDLYKGTRF